MTLTILDLMKKDIISKWSSNQYLESISKYINSIVNNEPDIVGADLSGIIIGPDAFIYELKSKSLYKSRIINSNLSYAKISGSMCDSSLIKVNLTKSNLDRCVMLDCSIADCDFSYAKLVVKMDDTLCENTNFSGAKIGAGSLGIEYGGRRVKFINCDFTNTLFNRVEFRASKFMNCNFSGSKFINCDLRGIKIEGGIKPLEPQFEKMDVPVWIYP
jgi:uncharacterized protein YjbI with pentapeptide repeats